MEERLRRLEQMVEQQQRQIGERDAKIARLEASQTAQQVTGKIASLPALADAPKGDDPNAVSVRWDKGLRFKTRDGATDLYVGGRIQWQLGYLSEDAATQRQLGLYEPDFANLRRAYLEMGGTFYRHVFWAAQFEHASDGNDDIRDMFIGLKDLPVVGQVRIGAMMEPFGLEQMESPKYFQFIERSFVQQAFGMDENFGIEFRNTHLGDRLHWAAGVFRDTDNSAVIRQDNNYMGTVRLTGLPWWEGEGRRHLHLGLSGRIAETSSTDDNETVRFRARPSVRTANRFLDTGNLERIVGDARLIGELALNWDRFNLSAEYGAVFLDSDGDRTVTRYRQGSAGPLSGSAGDVFLQAFQVSASYLLTGESRSYNRKAGCYGRLVPKRNFAMDGSGFGAVQLLARFHYLDFSDADGMDDLALPAGGVLGSQGKGTMWAWVGGVNWHLNPNTRIMANYNHINVNREYFDISPAVLRFRDRDYRSHAFVFMFQVDW